nr:uncharacterized protein LOC117274138 [Nicotiana tomentosiformis]
MGKLPIDDSDDFVTPPPKQIKEHVPPKKPSGVQPVDYDCELQKLKADVKQLHKQLKSFVEYISDKFKEVFELINSKFGASEDKYGAHPEEDTSGCQDNNDFVSNMEFGGNEDVDMDGCKVSGSEGKNVPHSQGDTSAHHRNNIVLDAADQLGVNIMEESSSVKVNMFIAKVTFTPDVAHVGAIGETVNEAAGEIKAESEKEKAPESQISAVCVTASVDGAAWEMKEQSKKEVPESQIVLNCGVFATPFAEYFIEVKAPPKQFNAYAHRRRFDALLWDYARKKMELDAQSDDETIGRQNKSWKRKK